MCKTALSSGQFQLITRIDLQRSQCDIQDIIQICTAFPCLEYLSVATESEARIRRRGIHESGFQKTFLSDGLAMLKNLRELNLDVHYCKDVSLWLSSRGVLNLAGLNNLERLRVPVYFLVETQPGNKLVVTDPALALPSSLKHLALSAEENCARYLAAYEGTTISESFDLRRGIEDEPFLTYPSWYAAFDFLEAVSGCAANHFGGLKEVIYSYGAVLLFDACHCHDNLLCICCEVLQSLKPSANYDVWISRNKNLYSDLRGHGIRLHVVEEDEGPWTFDSLIR